MKRTVLLLMSILLIAGCAPAYDKEEEIVQETNDKNKKETAIVPSNNISDENYKIILPYKRSKTKGIITKQIANRLDIKEFEIGLRRMAKEVFDPNEFYFQEGQYLTSDMVYDWLGRSYTEEQVNEQQKSGNTASRQELQQGLNPPLRNESQVEAYKESPRYLSHILEQDFLKKNGEGLVELGGIAIGLALKSNYQFQTEIGGPSYSQDIPKEEMLKHGKIMAGKVLQRIRNIRGLNNVPIMIALYREEKSSSLVPGNFVASTVVASQDMTIKDWTDVEEDYVLFPSKEAREKYFEDAANMEDFQQEIAENFPDYYGVIGKGYYIDEQLKKLTIDIQMEFNGEAEVIGLTQFVYGLIMETFPNYFTVEVKIKSYDSQESLLIREIGTEKPYVHIYK